MTKVLLEDICWGNKVDSTWLPTAAIIDLDMEDIMDQEEFWDAAEEALTKRYNIPPNGFKYTIITETEQ